MEVLFLNSRDFGVRIDGVEPDSAAERRGILPGDILLRIDSHPITDVLDYQFYLSEEPASFAFRRNVPFGTQFFVRKFPGGDPGFLFDEYLMDDQRRCRNNCVFCFIDQLPPGLRETLYFKDDDSRLSFFFGNYITLTNLTEHEVSRIIDMHISPLRVSVHTMNPELRCDMMGNKHAGEVLALLKKFSDAGIRMECQLVLCPGMNDGDELERSMRELTALPSVESVAAVPVGLTNHRDGLVPLRLFTPEEAAATVRQIEAFGNNLLARQGGHGRVFYPADEFYIRAGIPIPAPSFYGEFAQLENGVGMWALFADEFSEAFAEIGDDIVPAVRDIIIATGVAAAPLMEQLAESVRKRYADMNIAVVPVINRFFGEDITVAGLVTGRDLMEQLAAFPNGRLLIPRSMLRFDGDLFLDDVSVEDVRESRGGDVYVVECTGGALLDAVIK